MVQVSETQTLAVHREFFKVIIGTHPTATKIKLAKKITTYDVKVLSNIFSSVGSSDEK